MRILEKLVIELKPCARLTRYPKEYSAKNISKIAKLCYVPYGYNPSPEKHLEIEYNDRFFDYCYALFSDSLTAFEFCTKLVSRSLMYSNIKLYNLGFPRFDLVDKVKDRFDYKHYLWIPRWSLDSVNNDGSGFFEYVDILIDYFKRNQSLMLEIRPHPAMFKNFIKRGAMTEIEVVELKKRISIIPNITLDETSDYIPAFQRADVLIADFSSLDIEFAVTGKPVIYCGDLSEFNKETRQLANNFYLAHSKDELLNRIQSLLNGCDKLKKERIDAAISFRKSVNINIGKLIFDECIKGFK